MMRELIQRLPEQVEQAYENALNFTPSGASAPINNVLICGMGGSGIGGTIVAELLKDECAVPVTVVNDYVLPAFVDRHTLVIASSYSGNTEETYAALQDAMAKGAQVACITSGGKIGELAGENGFDCITIPGGNPPRSQFGFSAISQLRLFTAYGLIDPARFDRLSTLGDFLRGRQSAHIMRAEELVRTLADRIIILYAAQNNAGVAVRWRQQINENAKRLCWHHVYPEMNHNELVGWEGGDSRFGIIVMRSEDDHKRSRLRMEITEEMMRSKGALLEFVDAVGSTREERCFDLIQQGDWLSLLLAEHYGVDPVAIVPIEHLKSELSKA